MILILFVILLLLLIGAVPAWPYSRGWGYYPSGGIGLVVLILLVLLLMGRLCSLSDSWGSRAERPGRTTLANLNDVTKITVPKNVAFRTPIGFSREPPFTADAFPSSLHILTTPAWLGYQFM